MDSRKKRLLVWFLLYSAFSGAGYMIGGDIGHGLSLLGRLFMLGFLADVFEIKSFQGSFQRKSDKK